MFVVWIASPEKPLNILILDKTVLDSKTQEHLSLSWILTNEKFKHSISGKYEHNINYLGFFPNDSGQYKIKDFNRVDSVALDSIADLYNIAYYTDLYGIYEAEWTERYPNSTIKAQNNIDNSMEHSSKIYGGMTSSELKLLQRMKAKGKTCICEFNTIASPTSADIRQDFEKEFGIKWTGWTGRYYETLDTTKNAELPRWMKRNYLAQHNNKWPFKEPGIVFVRNDDCIEILENKTQLNVEVPFILTNQLYQAIYKVPAKMKYSFWFDIVETKPQNQVISMYHLAPNQKGRKLLQQYGIPETFPAVIAHDSTDYKFYYLAGDFCDNPIELKSAKLKYVEKISWLFCSGKAQERLTFFWDFYRPMVKSILDTPSF
jgi:hypothetical protein